MNFHVVGRAVESALGRGILNVSIQLESLPFKELWQRLPRQLFEMSLFCSHSQYTDIINFLERFEFGNAPRNFSGWENVKYKKLLPAV